MDSSDFDLSDIVQAAYAALDEEELPGPDPDPTPEVPTNEGSDATVTPPKELRFLKGRNSGRQVSYDGFVYTFDRQIKSGTCYWQCKDRRPTQLLAPLYSSPLHNRT